MLPNVICVGFDSIPPTATPLPSSGTTSGATDRLLTVAVSAPGWFPLAVGEKLTPTVQEVSATRFAAHVVSAGASEYGPVNVNVKLFAVCLPRLLIVNVRGAVVVPTAAEGKSNSATLDCRMIGGDPVPVRLTVVVAGIALLAVTVSVALSAPTTDGENVT